MPEIYDGISGANFIEEINHSVDERGKLQENGERGGIQEINGGLIIKGDSYVDDTKGNQISLQQVFSYLNAFASSPAVIDPTLKTSFTDSNYYQPIRTSEKKQLITEPVFSDTIEYEIPNVVCPNQSMIPTPSDYLSGFYNSLRLCVNTTGAWEENVYVLNGSYITVNLYYNDRIIDTYSWSSSSDRTTVEDLAGYYVNDESFSYYRIYLNFNEVQLGQNLNGDYKIKIDYNLKFKNRYANMGEKNFWVELQIGGSSNFLKYNYKSRYLEPVF